MIISSCIFKSIISQIGCMDNSHHLQQKYDSKEYHYVQCNCPCDRYAAVGKKAPSRNQCLECGHYHDPKPHYVASGLQTDKPTPKTTIPTPQTWLHHLIKKHNQNLASN